MDFGVASVTREERLRRCLSDSGGETSALPQCDGMNHFGVASV
jgi:hypothetical protein